MNSKLNIFLFYGLPVVLAIVAGGLWYRNRDARGQVASIQVESTLSPEVTVSPTPSLTLKTGSTLKPKATPTTSSTQNSNGTNQNVGGASTGSSNSSGSSNSVDTEFGSTNAPAPTSIATTNPTVIPTNAATTAPTPESIGLTFNPNPMNYNFPAGIGVVGNTFHITSTGATYYKVEWVSMWTGGIIWWENTAGPITPGETKNISIKVMDYVGPGTYNGTGRVTNTVSGQYQDFSAHFEIN